MTLIRDWFKNHKAVTAVSVGLGLIAAVNIVDRGCESQEEKAHRDAIESCTTYNALQNLLKGQHIPVENVLPSSLKNDAQTVSAIKQAAAYVLSPVYMLGASRTEYRRAYEKCSDDPSLR